MDDNTMLGHLAPVVHPKNWDLIRVPMMRVADGHYTVFVGDKTIRRYTDDTLPDALKSRLAMILTVPQMGWFHDHDLQKLNIYVNNHSPELDEIGWRVSDSYFCLVVSREILSSLIRGEQNGKDEAVD
jgi:hypothetical protein